MSFILSKIKFYDRSSLRQLHKQAFYAFKSLLVIHELIEINQGIHVAGVNSPVIMNEAYLLTGGNIGNRLEYLSKAKEAIKKRCGSILQQSSVYETAAWGMENQEAFLNQVLKIETSLNPDQLLKSLLQIEEDLGRKRELKYGPRTIDIDILFFNDEVIDEQGLKIPHPQLQSRRFVLIPLNEIASTKVHPVFRKTISQLLAECPDPLAVNKFN